MEKKYNVKIENGKPICRVYFEWVDENNNQQIIDTNDLELASQTIFKLLNQRFNNEELCDEMTEQLFEQLFGKFEFINQTDVNKKATIRTALTHVSLNSMKSE